MSAENVELQKVIFMPGFCFTKQYNDLQKALLEISYLHMHERSHKTDTHTHTVFNFAVLKKCFFKNRATFNIPVLGKIPSFSLCLCLPTSRCHTHREVLFLCLWWKTMKDSTYCKQVCVWVFNIGAFSFWCDFSNQPESNRHSRMRITNKEGTNPNKQWFKNQNCSEPK